MNQLKLQFLYPILFLAGSTLQSAFFDQHEQLYVSDHNTFHLKPYYNSRPKIFGLVSDKQRHWQADGYLCHATTYSEYLSKCYDKHPDNAWIVVHKYDSKYTEEFVNNLNDRVQKTEQIRAFILVDDDQDRRIGLNRDIKDSTYLSKINENDGTDLITQIEKSSSTFLLATFHQHFEPICRSYYTLEYLLAAFLAIQVVFTIPYIILSQKWQNHIANLHGIPALEQNNRGKFNMWIYMILIFVVLQTIALLLITSECPLDPFRDQDAGARAKSVITFLIVPLAQAMIDVGILYLAAYGVRSALQMTPGYGLYISMFILSFAVTAIQLIFKLVDTKYDMLLALSFPIFKLVPFLIAMRDNMNSQSEFKHHISDDTDATTGKLLAYFRLYETFIHQRSTIFIHYLFTIILGVFIAICAQKPHWVLCYTLLDIMQTFSLLIMAIVLFPTRWMTEEVHKVDSNHALGKVARMRNMAGQNEILLPPQ
eukprot:403349066